MSTIAAFITFTILGLWIVFLHTLLAVLVWLVNSREKRWLASVKKVKRQVNELSRTHKVITRANLSTIEKLKAQRDHIFAQREERDKEVEQLRTELAERDQKQSVTESKLLRVAGELDLLLYGPPSPESDAGRIVLVPSGDCRMHVCNAPDGNCSTCGG